MAGVVFENTASGTVTVYVERDDYRPEAVLGTDLENRGLAGWHQGIEPKGLPGLGCVVLSQGSRRPRRRLGSRSNSA